MGQQGDVKLIPEGKYDIFRPAVQSSLEQFHSSGHNANDFLEEMRSLIPTDEALKDEITWDMLSMLKASLAYCAKIVQGVVTADHIIIPPTQRSCWGGILLSLRPSVCPSIAATAIKPPKAACQFAADDILLYELCYYNPMDLLHHLEKGKEELSPLQYHIKTLQEESAKKSNIPWI